MPVSRSSASVVGVLAAVASVTSVSAVNPSQRHALFNGKHVKSNVQADTPVRASGQPGVQNCTLNWFTQTIDHFSWQAPPSGNFTYQQRYFTYDQYWNKETGAILFYAGNEADVTLYVDHTGLMWENAQALGALMVFAEHRYYGLSQPFGDASGNILQYLTHEQALADYATLVTAIQRTYNTSQPVILFGGSYGGMLAAWARIKYPAQFAGAIAASAPILAFHGMRPEYNNETYWQVVTNDASAAGGSAPACSANVRAAFNAIFTVAATGPAGLANLTNVFQLCSPLQTSDDVNALAILHLNAWDTMAMGNYPYPSNYLTGGGPNLPAWPVRSACSFLSDPSLATADPMTLLAAFNTAGAVFNNATANVECYALPTDIFEDGIWDYQWCTEMLPEEMYFTQDGVNDMFWPRAFNVSFVAQRCADKYGLQTRPYWIHDEYGSWAQLSQSSNIVFSNGGYDPWSSGGVKTSPGGSIQTVFIPEGGHHLDLFFSNPQDPASVTAARQTEMTAIQGWISAWYKARATAEAQAALAAEL